MTKLGTIKRELETNPNVFIASVDEFPPAIYPEGSSGLHEGYHVDFNVAPINGLYLPNQLNKFIRGLTTVVPYKTDKFSLWRDVEPYDKRCELKYTHRLRLGHIFFSEKIGQKKIDRETVRLVASRNLESDNLERLIKEVIPDGLPGTDLDIYRHIIIWIYPNPKIAKAKFGKNDFGGEMTTSHLRHYVPNIVKLYTAHEKLYEAIKRIQIPMEEIRNNLDKIVRLKIQ